MGYTLSAEFGDENQDLRMIYTRNPEIFERTLADELILVDNEADNIFNLNPIGRAIWQFLQEPRETKEIIETLQSAFPEVEASQIQEDATCLLHNLVQQGLIFVTPR